MATNQQSLAEQLADSVKPTRKPRGSRVKPKRKPKQAIVRRAPITIAEAIEKVLISGDLTPLLPEQRLQYYRAVCKSLGLNPLTRPFDFIAFKESEAAPARMALYARRDCTDQLRKLHGISVVSVKRSVEDGMLVAEVIVQDRDGRMDSAIGVVSMTKYDKWAKPQPCIRELTGLELANARMKAETKAKRRATLSIAGLGFLDMSEIDSMDPAEYAMVTPGGRLMTEESAEPKTAEVVATRTLAAAEPDGPCLFYRHYPESDTYQILGSESLKTANRDLLGPLWSSTAGQIVATPAQLGKLISQFETRKVPFRETN